MLGLQLGYSHLFSNQIYAGAKIGVNYIPTPNELTNFQTNSVPAGGGSPSITGYFQENTLWNVRPYFTLDAELGHALTKHLLGYIYGGLNVIAVSYNTLLGCEASMGSDPVPFLTLGGFPLNSNQTRVNFNIGLGAKYSFSEHWYAVAE